MRPEVRPNERRARKLGSITVLPQAHQATGLHWSAWLSEMSWPQLTVLKRTHLKQLIHTRAKVCFTPAARGRGCARRPDT